MIPVRVIPSFIGRESVGGYYVLDLPHLGTPWLYAYRHVELPVGPIVNDRGEWNDAKATLVFHSLEVG